jgi:hypothetical protein
MRGAVEGVGQPQDVLEILAHRGQPPPLGKTVGVQRHQDARADAPDPDQAPQPEQEKDLPPGVRPRASAAARKRIDDAAERQRAEEAGGGERRVRFCRKSSAQGDLILPRRERTCRSMVELRTFPPGSGRARPSL